MATPRPTENVTRYFTFGQAHVHRVNGRTFDADVLAKITAPDPRAVMVEHFGRKWAFEYTEPPEERFWPGGMIELG